MVGREFAIISDAIRALLTLGIKNTGNMVPATKGVHPTESVEPGFIGADDSFVGFFRQGINYSFISCLLRNKFSATISMSHDMQSAILI